MRIAFYAPLKPPDDPTPSGDRRIARLLLDALRLAGHEPFVASGLRSYDGIGDPARQASLAEGARRCAEHLLARWRQVPVTAPKLWFTYHLYYKAPDWLGPLVSEALGIPYVIAEASYAPKREGGWWDLGHRAVEQALRRADAVLGLNPADRACVLPLLRDPQRWNALAPFIDTTPYRVQERRLLETPCRLIAVAMMRPGDKLASYSLLGAALADLLDLEWSLDIVGDGAAGAEVEAALAPLGTRVRYRGALDDIGVAAALAAADLFVWPAINEAFGMALLEAQASGLPVVAGGSGGVGGIVDDGETGLLAPPGDVGAFAAGGASPGPRRCGARCDGGRGVSQGRTRARPASRGHSPRGGDRTVRADASGVSGSVLFHVQYLLGIGHLQRTLRIAEALACDGLNVTVVSGGAPVALPMHPAIRFVQLSPVRALNARFELVDDAGAPLDEALRERRRFALLAAFATARPDVVVIEGYPFARRAFRFELDPLIASVKAATPRPRLLCSLRDIVVMRDDPERRREIVARVRRDFDTVLVHGDPAFIPLEASFSASPELADRLIYTGYVSPPDESPGRRSTAIRMRPSSRRAGVQQDWRCSVPRSARVARVVWLPKNGDCSPAPICPKPISRRCAVPRQPEWRSSGSGQICHVCCRAAASRSARRATTPFSTSSPLVRARSSCRLRRGAKPSSSSELNGWRRSARSSWCARASCRRRPSPWRSSGPPRANRRRWQSTATGRRARPG